MGAYAVYAAYASLALAANQAYENSGGQQMPGAPEPEPEKQAGQAPDANVYRKKNANAAGVLGPGRTLLTGLTGVSDDMLSLGKHTLLGQ